MLVSHQSCISVQLSSLQSVAAKPAVATPRHTLQPSRCPHAQPSNGQACLTARQQRYIPHSAPPRGAQPSNGQSEETDPAYKYSDGVNQFLGNFLPSNKAARDELTVDFSAPKLAGISIQELAQLVEQGLSKTQWFVTGEVDARLFADNFVFKDESVATSGIKAYATGVRKLFDQATSKVEIITVTANTSNNTIVVVWRLEGRVNLPFKPKIKPYVVTTTFGIDSSSGLINSQLDEFAVPGWDLLLSTFLGAGFGAAPARPVEQLKAAAAAGQKLQ